MAGQKARTTVICGDKKEYKWIEFLPLAFGGWCFYVRQDVSGDQIEGGGVLDRELGGIQIPQSAADRCQFVTVLGIGPRVGQPCTKAHMAEFGREDRMASIDGVKVGDRLLLAMEDGQTTRRIQRSPLNWECEMFIEESLPDAIVED